MKPAWKRNFKDWITPDVVEAFGLVEDNAHPPFRDWVDAEPVASPEALPLLENRRRMLARYYAGWNETELMMHFIAPLFYSVSFEGKNYGTFFHRKLNVVIDGQPLGGIADALVATGVYDPVKPFFFLNEYKRSQGYTADPQGQLLAAMVAAQHLNNSPRVVYGSFIIGKFCTFALLDGQTLALSQGYDLIDPQEIQTVWAILQRTKQRIEAEVAALEAAEA